MVTGGDITMYNSYRVHRPYPQASQLREMVHEPKLPEMSKKVRKWPFRASS